jgi:pyruvate ferredoxin oxidoreductase alpha subunit
MEIRHSLQQDLCRTVAVVEEADRDYRALTGRGGHPLFECYRCDDAEFITICMGSLSRQLRNVVDTLRTESVRAGVIALRLYRPFPAGQLAAALEKARGVLVFEKAVSYGYEGPLASELKAALYDRSRRPIVHNCIVGLGGRTITTADLHKALADFCAGPETVSASSPQWIGLAPLG